MCRLRFSTGGKELSTAKIAKDAKRPLHAAEAGSAAYKMHNLQLVAFGKFGVCPGVAGGDAAVEFHGNPILLHP